MAIAGGPALPQIPPSAVRDGGLYKHRFLGKVQPDRPVQKGYGSLWAMVVLAAVAILVMGAATYLGLQAQANVRVTISSVSVQAGPCVTYPSGFAGPESLDCSVLLTNSGSHNAVATLNLYANGTYVGSSGGIVVPAGQTILVHATAQMDACGPVAPSATLEHVEPAP